MAITLKSARVNVGLTQVKAAEKIGITVDTLSNYERGKSYPDVPVIQKIEEVYGVSYSDLIFLPKNYGKTVTNKEE
ncbi:MAG: XRE family transcriptional regulator [Pseudobutyrivibrio sp.]|nr:XRE family transcriptional regulator [Pseudobutyrivibrio sp.]